MAPTDNRTSGGETSGPLAFPFQAIQEINERMLELLAQLARGDSHESVALPSFLRQRLRESSPADRKRAAARAYLLVDLQFRNIEWWDGIARSSTKPARGSAMGGPFPRRAAVPLTRATLVTAREAIRTDSEIACILLSVAPKVAESLSRLTTTEIDRIAEQRFPQLEPRWLDRPAIWHSMLRWAGPGRALNNHGEAYSVQLLTGSLVRKQPTPETGGISILPSARTAKPRKDQNNKPDRLALPFDPPRREP